MIYDLDMGWSNFIDSDSTNDNKSSMFSVDFYTVFKCLSDCMFYTFFKATSPQQLLLLLQNNALSSIHAQLYFSKKNS